MKAESVKISVVMSVYNGEKYLREAIDSILAQTFADFEFIIIDDGSSDNSAEIIQSYDDQRIRFFQQENKGLPFSLNRAASLAKGSYIARMDQDDICFPDRLKKQFAYMESSPHTGVLGSSVKLMSADGDDLCVLTLKTEDKCLRACLPDSPFVHPSVMIRKTIFDVVGGYPEFMSLGGEDAVLFGKISKISQFHNLGSVLISYRLVPGSLSRKPAYFRELLRDIIHDSIEGVIPNEKITELSSMAKSMDKESDLFQYYFEISKLCLWSGSPSKKTCHYIFKCLSIAPFSLKAYLLFIMTFIPKVWLKGGYSSLKGRSYTYIEPDR